jgi:transcriptional regulator with XRE-family HTH domain
MSSRKLQNYLRTHRKRRGLSQSDVAFLLGSSTGARVSRYEGFRRQPTLQTAFAYEVIFGISARELFAGLYEQVHRATVQRTQVLAANIRGLPPARCAVRKLNHLEAILSRSQSEGSRFS